ncbi:flagellar basal body-associated protein FliL [Desulfofarcimen acetoxidans DSM 771]|jgi:flagellar FliL protein|uniref:Flagellar protein FliL n=1 Tax=Desulfofarcimen acetoxidans (strain ATCC 49208 / DSM 771 / KCTC 5769 / VKM B-1644 / 5575) TaxID=485916 RepID=C8W1G6_DESAS|nr:flagellar basal body-associated FliL family protein [Desulfofarcimen acetoxidans]ACV61611.1 flagellar basal body-associated protein FliL [Desulfofarcimen acetoxidans DSM 771]
MATEKPEKKSEGQETKKSKNKLIIIIIAIVVLLASAAGSYYFFVIKAHSSKETKKEEPKPEISTFELGSIVVNLADQGHFLRVSPVLEYEKDEKMAEEVKTRKSEIIDQVITILRKKSVENCSKSLESIKEEIIAAANKSMEEPVFKRLYFVELLVQ